MKKIMILGAGIYQIPLIKQAKAMGIYTIVVSVQGNYPGFDIADKVYYADVRDEETVLSIAKQENIDGIITDQTDIPVRTVSYVAQKLSLSGNPYETAVLFTDKYLMRERCKEIGVPVLQYKLTDNLNEALDFYRKLGKAVILKPVDNQGSRGIIKIQNEKELTENFGYAKSNSKCGNVLVEQYVTGREFVVEGIALNYEYKNLICGDTIYFDSMKTFSANRRVFPTTADYAVKKKLLELNETIARGFGIKQGITHGEYIVDSDNGEIYLIEIAARGGGVHISSDLISLKTGLNTEQFLIKLALGELTEMPSTIDKDIVCGYVAFYLPQGVVKNADDVKKLDDMPFVKNHICDSIYCGKKTGSNTNKTSRYSIIICADSREQFENYRQMLKDELKIAVETDKGTEYPIWE